MPHTDAAATLEHLARATAQSDSANRRETSRTIIVAADGSSLADQALAFAAPVARGWGGQLVLVRAAARIDPSVLSGAESLVAAATHELSELARTADELGRRADLLRSDGVVAAARIGVGEPSAVILDAARSANADLIVMGTRRSSGLRRWWHGSIADRVLRAAEAPVVVVPDRWQGWQHPQHGRHILVPLDGSAVAEQALRPARALAAALHARMVLVRVVPPVRAAVLGHGFGAVPVLQEAALSEAREALELVASALASRWPICRDAGGARRGCSGGHQRGGTPRTRRAHRHGDARSQRSERPCAGERGPSDAATLSSTAAHGSSHGGSVDRFEACDWGSQHGSLDDARCAGRAADSGRTAGVSVSRRVAVRVSRHADPATTLAAGDAQRRPGHTCPADSGYRALHAAGSAR
jgi:nucleotide-binding universal stress UspA family protein